MRLGTPILENDMGESRSSLADRFATKCGLNTPARVAAAAQCVANIREQGLKQVRFVWCDLHGTTRGKTLMAHAIPAALQNGVGMVSTLMLKDTSDRTVYKVFEPGGADELPGFACASNLLLMADPTSLKVLPWQPDTGWLQCQPWFDNATPVELDSRHVLQKALAHMADSGLGMVCGLEVEFHIYRIDNTQAQLDPSQAAWPGLPPDVAMIHPGYNLHSETCLDLADEALTIVRETAQALGLPLQSLEIELGPSQVEAVFDATDALTAADNMVLFRNGVRQALRQKGYHATFMCRPPFPNIMSSGWHLHQSLVQLDSGHNAFMRDAPQPGTSAQDALHTLTDLGAQYLAGLLTHAQGMAVLCTPTVNGFGRFRPNALAPQAVLWGKDNRGAMLRVVGQAQDKATRIENRLGEPAANPYLYMAAQVYAGLDGIKRQLMPPPATDTPYGNLKAEQIPSELGSALTAFRGDTDLTDALGKVFVNYFCRCKQSELDRYCAADDKDDFQRREYFSRI